MTIGFHRLAFRRRFRAAAALLLTLAAASIRAQTPPPTATPPATAQATPAATPQATPTPTTGATEPSNDEIQSRLERARQSTELDESIKTQLIQIYEQTLQRRGLADQFAARAVEFEQLRLSAPDRLRGIEEELRQPVAQPQEPPEDIPLAELKTLSARAAQALADAQRELSEVEGEIQRRTERRTALRDERAASVATLEEIERLIQTPPPADEPAELTEARRNFYQARRRARQNEIKSFDEELLSYDARRELLPARRNQTSRRLSEATAQADLLRERVSRAEREEAERALAAARRAAMEAQPALREIARAVQSLAAERTGPESARSLTERALTQREQFVRQLDDLKRRRESITSRVEATGLNNTIGLLLRREQAALPDLRDRKRSVRRRTATLREVQLRQFERYEEWASLSDHFEAQVAELLTQIEPAAGQTAQELESSVRELLNRRITLTNDLQLDYDRHFSALSDLDEAERSLIAEAETFADYIAQRVLWIPSEGHLRWSTVTHLWTSTQWLLDPRQWSDAVAAAFDQARRAPWMLALAILGFGTLIASRRMMRARLVAVGDEVMGRGRTDFKVTLIAAGYTAVLALTWPALIWAAGWFLTINPSAPTFVAAVGEGAQAAALALLPFALLIEVCAPRGLADAHLAWPESCRRALKLNIGAMMFWVVSLVFVVSVLLNQEDESLMESLGRLAMIAASIVLSVHLMRMLRPRGTVLGPYIERHPHGWINRLRFAWYGAVVALPLALVALSAAGYTRTAIHFSSQLYGSVWMVLIAVLLFALSERFVIVARHRLALERERRRREEAAMRGADDDEAPAKTAPPAPAGADLDVIDAQTRRLVTITLGFALLVGFWFVWVDVMPALGILKNVTVWSSTQPAIDSEGLPTTQMMTVSLADVLLALAILFMGFVGARNIPGVLEIAILSRLPLNSGLRFAITTLTRYAITVVCFIAAFGLIGVSWSKVQWLVAAMTVGLGFGLQEIFANFVSGLIILFERPIRVGDIVTVGEISGSVSQINMRATTIVDWDRRELIVPNKEFITNRLINWTLTDPITRVVFEIGIAYGSNTELARELLVKAAANDPNVMKDPPPHARFISFGDSALIFRLYTFIPVRDVYLDMVHALNTEIDQSFRKAGIEIAFPQRDLHLDASAPIPVRMIETSEGRAGGPIVEMPGAPELSRASKD